MSIIESLVSVFAPHSCLGCGLNGTLLCHDCTARLDTPVPACYRCGQPARLGRTCLRCRQLSPLVSVNSATTYSGLAKDLLWRLKFDRAQTAAGIAGAHLAEMYGELMADDTLVVPVPTARSRARKRGYDQAELIARSLAGHTELVYAPLLVRSGKREQKGASRQQRYDQMRGAYRLLDGRTVAGCRIMLIDDVLTTGATMEEAALVLRAAGARSVGALVFARALL